jgi:iron complex transport system substrate-binding protein
VSPHARALGALAVLALAASPAAGLTVRDQAGRTLTLPAPPARIVSLVPSATEVLFALGAQDRLAGVTDFCDFPPAARAKPRVGGMVAPNLESIAALRPDLVIATTEGNREETVLQVERLGIPVFLLNPASVEQAMDVVERLGKLADRAAAGEALVAQLRARIDRVAGRVAGRKRPRVLYVVWPEPLIVPGRASLVSDLLSRAGGASITTEAGAGYVRYSIEAAVAQAPEVILLARHGAPTSPIAREAWTRFAHLPAMREGRVHDVDGNLLHRYGPRMVDGLEGLARLIHPEAFSAAGR